MSESEGIGEETLSRKEPRIFERANSYLLDLGYPQIRKYTKRANRGSMTSVIVVMDKQLRRRKARKWSNKKSMSEKSPASSGEEKD